MNIIIKPNDDFPKAWFKYLGLNKKETEVALNYYRGWVSEFPLIYKVIFIFLSYTVSLAPLPISKNLRRVSSLESAEFESFLDYYRFSNLPFKRLILTFLVYPLCNNTVNKDNEYSVHEKNHKVRHPLKKFTTNISKSNIKEYDVTVIGSGAGGAPAAWNLTKNGLRVALIEKGSFMNPGSITSVIRNSFTSQGLLFSPRGSMMPVYAGSTVGGTTSINMGTFMRPNSALLKKWDTTYNTNFASSEFNAYLKFVEKRSNVTIIPHKDMNPSSKTFINGLEKINKYLNISRLNHSFRDDDRKIYKKNKYPNLAIKSTDFSFLLEAVKSGLNLYIKSEAMEIKDGKKEITIKVKSDNNNYNFKTKKLVISAGAIHTPKLIKDNKLGTNWKDAGKNLSVHPATSLYAYFDQGKFNTGLPQDIVFKSDQLPGITIEGIKTPKEFDLLSFISNAIDFRFWVDNYENVADMGVLVKDTGRGRVRYINDIVLIDYKLNKSDAYDLGKALVFMAEVFFKAGATKVLFPISSRNSTVTTLAQVNKINVEKTFTPKMLNTSAFHPSGTAGLGRLVDNQLRILGSENIYISDASVIPEPLGVNPQEFIMANSLNIADKVSANF